MREKLIEILSKYFDIGDSYAYNLTRVKTAFEVGTMSLEDFEEFDEETISDLADYLIKNGVVIPPCKVGDTVYQTDGVRVYESTIKNVIYVTEGVSFDKNAIGKSIFLTRKDAEKEIEE
jgi:hypothetical protein